ncbi:hypothetical protein LMG26696_03022 [Achromobacter pulmonis]|nr:hypothetical protein LMG26696_03022 [Achromobacter pulmonis]
MAAWKPSASAAANNAATPSGCAGSTCRVTATRATACASAWPNRVSAAARWSTARLLISAPNSAMPMVMPVWRSAFMVAEAMPERSRGTVAITAMLVAGTASPMPRPSSTISDPDRA